MGKERVRSYSPQQPFDLVVETAAADGQFVAKAADVARDAQRAWAADGPFVRAAALAGVAEELRVIALELAELIAREVGKPVLDARAEVERSAEVFRYHSQQALGARGEVFPAPHGTLLMTSRRPLGLAGLITPWNFPLAIPSWKIAPALAVGNAVLFKPAVEATAVGLRLGEVLDRFLPPGLCQVIPGTGAAGRAIIDHADVVSFTGSVEVGTAIVRDAIDRLMPVQCEMGGHNASVVLPDADLESAAEMIASASMGYAGQRCTATRRIVVVGDPAPFTEAFVAAVRNLGVGDPLESTTDVGPVITATARENIGSAIDYAVDQGGTIATGGGRLYRPGWFVEPTVVTGLDASSRLAQHEVFGPVCTILSAADPGEAVEISNSTDYGLSTALFTRDLDAAMTLAPQFRSGLVKVNAPTTGADPHVPFSGLGKSGFGPPEQGSQALDFFSSTQTLTVKNSQTDL